MYGQIHNFYKPSLSLEIILFIFMDLELYFIHYHKSEENLKIYSYGTLMIKYYACFCIQRHPGCVIETKSSIKLRHSTYFKCGLDS